MRISSLITIVLAVVLVVSLVSMWFYPSVQDFMAGNTMWNGIRDFSRTFSAREINSLNDLPDQPEKDVLISMPYIEYNDSDLAGMKQFINRGGIIVLMDDFGYGNSLPEYLGITARFNHNILLDPLFSYKNQYLPRVTDFSPQLEERGVEAIVLNHATVLEGVENSNAMAFSSNMSFLDINQNGFWDQGEPKGPFVVAAEFQVGKGMLELISDPSLIINSMVKGNDNQKFIWALVNRNGEPDNLIIDYAHLTKSPLDVSKRRLSDIREVLSMPYSLIGFTALIFAVISWYGFKRGIAVD